MRLAAIFLALILAGSALLLFFQNGMKSSGSPFPAEGRNGADTAAPETGATGQNPDAAPAPQARTAPAAAQTVDAPSAPHTETPQHTAYSAAPQETKPRARPAAAAPRTLPADPLEKSTFRLRAGDRLTIEGTTAILTLTSVKENEVRVQVREKGTTFSYTLNAGGTVILSLAAPEVIALEAESVFAEGDEVRFVLWRYPRTKIVAALPATVTLRVGQTAAVVHRPDFVERITLRKVGRLHAELQIETLMDARVARVFTSTYQQGDTLGTDAASVVLRTLSFDAAYSRTGAAWGPHTITLELSPVP